MDAVHRMQPTPPEWSLSCPICNASGDGGLEYNKRLEEGQANSPMNASKDRESVTPAAVCSAPGPSPPTVGSPWAVSPRGDS